MENRMGALAGALLFVCATALAAAEASAQRAERWTDPTPAGVFFNDYDPNFYTGWVPRVQDHRRIKVHLGRGNQLRIRMVLPDATVDNYLTDQVAKHDLYQEVIDRGVITLTSNTAWENYHATFEAKGLREKARLAASLAADEWRARNLAILDELNPERLYHIRKSFDELASAWRTLLAGSEPPAGPGCQARPGERTLPAAHLRLRARRRAVGGLRRPRSPWRRARTAPASGPDAEAFFHDVTGGIYPLRDG